MDKKPLVSVIMIFLDPPRRFFEEAIGSAFSQTYDNWELLLVDDGSTNGSTEIALRCLERNPGKVSYLAHERHQNQGMSASRNLGIRHAKGKYIGLLDADDIWLPEKLHRQVAILEAHAEAAMVYGSTLMWYSWTGKPEDGQRDCLKTLGVPEGTLVQPPALLPLFLERKADPPSSCSVLIRRELIEKVGGFEESFRNQYEDQVFFAKVCLEAPVFVESGCWQKYRQHQDSACSRAMQSGEYHRWKPHPAGLVYLNWLERHLRERGIRNAPIRKSLRKALRPYRHPILNELTKPDKVVRWVYRQALPLSLRRWLRGSCVRAR